MLGDLGKLIVAKGFKKLPKVQKIARSGHTVSDIQIWLPLVGLASFYKWTYHDFHSNLLKRYGLTNYMIPFKA